MAEQKQFDATPRKVKKAREKGNTAKSAIFTHGFVYLAGLGCLLLFLPVSWERVHLLIEYGFLEGFRNPLEVATLWLLVMVILVVTFFGFLSLTGLLFDLIQVGVFFRLNLVLPDVSRCNPFLGFSKICKGLKEIPSILVRLSCFFVVLYFFLFTSIELFASAFESNDTAVYFFLYSTRRILWLGFVALLVSGLCDFILKRRIYKRELSMSLDELRREHREEEGNPDIRQHRRQTHRAISMQDLVTRVRNSKVKVVASETR